MKCVVRLTKTIDLKVEGRTEEDVLNWLMRTTPDDAEKLVDDDMRAEYNEEIIRPIDENSEVDYVIGEF